MKWKNHTISADSSVRECFEKINSLSSKFLVVLNNHGGVENTVTDGDLRRYIINNGNLDSQLHDLCDNKPKALIVSEAESRQQLTMKLSDKIEFIPIVGAKDELVDIFHPDMASFRVGSHTVSADGRSLMIAEIGNNHNGSLERAYELIDKAVWAGADVVKFQMRQLEDLYARSDMSGDDLGSQYTRDLLEKYQLSNDEFQKVFDYCEKLQVTVLCTPFDLASVDILESMNILAYKVASADFMNWALLDSIAATGKPMLISTGMTTESDLKETCDYLNRIHANYVLLHCNSSYPAPYKDVNLSYFKRLKTYSLYPFSGYSGHERGFHIPLAAVSMGARIIEKHFTLDKNMEGNDHKVSLLPEEFKLMVSYIRDIETAIGSSKDRALTQGEMLNRDVLGKSLTAISDIRSGEVFSSANIGVKSPGGGIPPHKLNELFGRLASRDFCMGDQLFERDLSNLESLATNFKFQRPVGIPVRYHDYAKLTQRNNIDFVEFHFSYADLNLDQADYITKNADLGFVVHAPELFKGDHLLDLSSLDPSYRKESFKNLERTLAATKKLKDLFPSEKKPLVVTNVGGWSLNEFLSDSIKKQKYELIAEALDEFRSSEYEIIIQTMPPFPWHFGGQRYHNLFMDPLEIRTFCDKHDHRICLDISHTYLAVNFLDQGWESAIDTLGPISAHLHVVDGSGVDSEGLDIGEGTINFKDLGDRLSVAAPEVPFIPEIWQGHKDSGAGFWKALQKLNGLL
jgi:N-acetylneuraminate synthase